MPDPIVVRAAAPDGAVASARSGEGVTALPDLSAMRAAGGVTDLRVIGAVLETR